MPPGRDTYNAFVVRIWQEEDAVRDEMVWRGWVQHAGTEERTYFRDLAALLAFIEGHTGALRTAETQQSPRAGER